MKMGELIDFVAWKKQKASVAQAKELAEIAELREEVKRLMDDMGEPEVGPYYISDDEKSWMRRMTEIMLTSLDGYDDWPIDSSDM